MVEQPLPTINPEEDFQVQVRLACKACDARGREPGSLRGHYTCLVCGGTGYKLAWLKVDDLRDVLQWRAKRDPGPELLGGA